MELTGTSRATGLCRVVVLVWLFGFVLACSLSKDRAPGAVDEVVSAEALQEAEHEPLVSRFDNAETYIGRVFREQIGEIPRMGWFAGRVFLAAEEHPSVALYARPGLPPDVPLRSAVELEEEENLRRWSEIACELEPGHLVAYALEDEYRTWERALYTARSVPGQPNAGMSTRLLSPTEIRAVTELLGWPASGILRSDEGVTPNGGGAFYSLHQRFNEEAELAEEALFHTTRQARF